MRPPGPGFVPARQTARLRATHDMVLEITRHFRDDVAHTLNMRFDEAVLPGVANSATEPSADSRRTPTKNAIAY